MFHDFRPSGVVRTCEPLTDATRSTAGLSDSDREKIELLLSWAPYGDPPEDEVAVRFGVSLAEMKARIVQLVQTAGVDVVTPLHRTLLVRAAKLVGTRVPLMAPAVEAEGRRTCKPLNYAKPGVRELFRRAQAVH